MLLLQSTTHLAETVIGICAMDKIIANILCWRTLWRTNDIKGSLKDSGMMTWGRLLMTDRAGSGKEVPVWTFVTAFPSLLPNRHPTERIIQLLTIW